MQIGELAKQGGVGVQTLRFYERRGLLPEPKRKESGYRVYGQGELHRLRFIRHAKALGFSLKEIGEILKMRQRGECPCGEVIGIAERHLQDVERQIKHWRRFHLELSRATKEWKRAGKRKLSADAICVLIERTMSEANEGSRK